MKKIKIYSKKHGCFEVLVDDEDYPLVSQHKWYVTIQSRDRIYAITYIKKENGKYTGLRMHRLIMSPDKNEDIDHINHNCLDNRKANLRKCTRSQNSQNSLSHTGTSIFKGVSWHKYVGRWQATIVPSGSIKKHLGYFSNEIDAAKVYDKKALELFGEFALTNKMMGLY